MQNNLNNTPETPLISVIMPIYNSQAYLEQAIRSVIDQEYTHWELLLVDDCSTDAGWQMVRQKFSDNKRIRLYQLPHNSGGPAGPRNFGLQHSTGEYVAFLDADDIWHPAKLLRQLSFMQEREMGFSCTQVIPFRAVAPAHTWAIEPTKPAKQFSEISQSSLLMKNIVATSSVMLRRSVMPDLTFSEQPQHVGVEDYIFWLDVHANEAVSSARINEKLVLYRQVAGSLSRNKLVMAKKVWGLLGDRLSREKYFWVKRIYYFCSYILLGLLSATYR